MTALACEACQSRFKPDNCPMCKLGLLAQARDKLELMWRLKSAQSHYQIREFERFVQGGRK